MHRFLIVGYGSIGERHAAMIRESGVADVAAVYDTDSEKRALARNRGFKACDTLEELLTEPADLAIVATPNDSHRELVCRLLRAGKHVLAEKPAALSLEELDEMYSTADREGRILSVSQTRRWDADFLAIRRVLDEKLLGEVFRIESRVYGSRGIPAGWRREKSKGGGMLYDWGPHLIDQILLACSGREPSEVFCQLSHVTESEVDDGFTLTLGFPGGLRALIEVGTCNYISLPRFYVCGRRGTALINDWRENCQVTQCFRWEEQADLNSAEESAEARIMTPRDGQSVRQFSLERPQADPQAALRNFCLAAEGKTALAVRRDEVMSVVRVIRAAFASEEQKRPVDLCGNPL